MKGTTSFSSFSLLAAVLNSAASAAHSTTRNKKAKETAATQLLRDPRSYLHNPRNYLSHSRDYKKEDHEEELSEEESFFWTRELSSQSFSLSHTSGWKYSLSMSHAYDWEYDGVPTVSSNKNTAPTTNTTADPPKTSWPECVDEPLTCEDCKKHIEEENHPEITMITVVPFDSFVTADYRLDRVRIFCNDTAVTTVPTVG
mmetsp:Transcript_23908/g.34289  ORF Transcript_23908/g.34289 Transcript_23908/m.34289 type:complete len:200 (+) Transcript_23908:169-768(+)|eukprot:CAMPEP_0172417410 /NCGR_PEP_ID=MMETSP1064-20121228/3930_1 /TAXON_ID=202472 /ORGANISM="Aulacoseira subarctica , Strain CCAP 1002/5" /LENGTH=199 /DNA_ID=CAMNT_0013155723 /DNA_START=162 /DNA_END=761 /DNA_ORIENTATION=+